MNIGEFSFKEGDVIRIGAYIFEIRHGELFQRINSVCGGVGYVDFNEGIFLLLLQYVPTWSIEHKLQNGE